MHCQRILCELLRLSASVLCAILFVSDDNIIWGTCPRMWGNPVTCEAASSRVRQPPSCARQPRHVWGSPITYKAAPSRVRQLDSEDRRLPDFSSIRCHVLNFPNSVFWIFFIGYVLFGAECRWLGIDSLYKIRNTDTKLSQVHYTK